MGAPTGVCASSCVGGALVGYGQATGCEALPNDVQCCVMYPCTYSSAAGVCTDTCAGTAYSSSDGASGCAAFADNIQCCLSSSMGDQSSSNNQGSVITGGSACTYNGVSGACLTSSSCQQQSGALFATTTGARGCESFAADVQCCVPSASQLQMMASTTTSTRAPVALTSGAIAGIIFAILFVICVVAAFIIYVRLIRKLTHASGSGSGEIAYANASYDSSAKKPSLI